MTLTVFIDSIEPSLRTQQKLEADHDFNQLDSNLNHCEFSCLIELSCLVAQHKWKTKD